jgi:predicted CXXCH cytochrome family protein
MARASGPATQDFAPGEFQHDTSGVHYRVYLEDGDAWLSFDRDGKNSLHGKRKLLYFIGSGHRGKTYLFSDDDFLFESPINLYSQKASAWDMAPAYQHAREMPLNLPAMSSCLACHTSGAQPPIAGTENKYSSPVFAHAGITCERCHGAAAAHIAAASAGKGTNIDAGVVNPAKLSPARRDQVCMACHLEGNAAIEQPGKHLYQFQPGENLSDFVRYFVLTGDGKENVRAVSQFEALAQSKCKRVTGDAMTCTSCHDPHSSPAPEQRVAFYRAKCLACHGEPFAAKHHAEQQDCTQCHMPRVTTDVAHTQSSDHRILRVPAMPLQSVGNGFELSHEPPPEPQLKLFPATEEPANIRDLTLAWVALAEGGSRDASIQGEKLLPQALQQAPDDPALLTALGFVEQRRKELDKAREHYEHALRVDPLLVDAASNLAVLEANAGHLERAITLWRPAFERAPQRSGLGLNLARAYCVSGHAEESQATLVRVLEFNPDSSAGRSMLASLQSGQAKCTPPITPPGANSRPANSAPTNSAPTNLPGANAPPRNSGTAKSGPN